MSLTFNLIEQRILYKIQIDSFLHSQRKYKTNRFHKYLDICRHNASMPNTCDMTLL